MTTTGLGGEALPLPVVGDTQVIESIMESARASLPELDPLRQQPIATPMRRTVRCLIEKALLRLGQTPFQLATVTDHSALRRRPGTQSTAQRADLIVAVGFIRSELLDTPFYAHL